jgi:hypothetical protein
VGAVFARTGDGSVRQADDELQRRLPPDALLRSEASVRFAACARSSRASRRAKPNFTSCSVVGHLEFAAKSRKFDFFRFRIAAAGDGRAALCAELFVAALILPVESP